ncbi:MAG TPA: hypothetical protein VIY26_13090, partial [Acidimicrobiales bacterium]
YPLFLPPNVETQDRDGSNSVSDYCGYHRAFTSGTAVLDYADLPYEPSACPSGQAPNANATADGAVSTLSHELNEAVTDPNPTGSDYAWNDSKGNEIGDICGQNYGPPLGSTDPKNPGRTEYNQVINGGKYYVQTEFSDAAYSSQGTGHGCVQSEALAQHPSSPSGTTVAFVFADAYPTRLASDGSATSSIRVGVGERNNQPVSGDPITFQTYVRSGKGRCGRLSKGRATTDDGGVVTVTYTASTSDVPCEVAAIEGDGGQSADSVIYQGTSQAEAPTIHAKFPASVGAGGMPATFTVTLTNPSSTPVPNAQLTFSFFAGNSSSPKVDASEVHLAYSSAGVGGPFTAIALSGDTSNGDSITGYAGSPVGSTLPAKSTLMYTLHLSVDSDAPAESNNRPLLDIESYLEQIDSATGTGTVLDDSTAFDLQVTR